MQITKYTEQDREALIQLWEKVFPDDPPHNAPAKVIDEKLAVDDLIFVAKENGLIVGAAIAGYDGHRGWLYAVAVDQNQRKKGVGQLLVDTAVEALEEKGCLKVNLQIRSSNTAVIEFYESLGFKVEDRVSMGKRLYR